MKTFKELRGDRPQEEIARKVGVTSRAIFNWEHGLAKPRLEKIQPLATALNVTVDQVLALFGEQAS